MLYSVPEIYTRTPEQAQCYKLLLAMKGELNHKYRRILSLLSDDTIIKGSGFTKEKEERLCDICKTLNMMRVDTEEKNEGRKYHVLLIRDSQENKTIESPSGVMVAVWLTNYQNLIQKAIRKIESSIEQGIDAEELKRVFVDMETRFNEHRQAIMNLPYIVSPEELQRKLPQLKTYYDELLLVSALRKVDENHGDILSTFIDMIREITEYDFSDNVYEGVKKVMCAYEYFEDELLIDKRYFGNGIFSDLKRWMEFFLFSKKL